MIQTSIGGITFSEGDRLATLATLDGWYSGAPKRVDVANYPMSDGASPVRKDWRGSRVITQTGLIDSASVESSITGPWAQFSALQSDGSPSLFQVSDALGTLSCLVSVEINELTPLLGGLASYELVMVARDPVKYGSARVLSTGLPTAGGGLEYPLHSPAGALFYGANGNLGRVTLTNAGTAAVWPSVVVSGGLTAGFYIQRLDTGQVVRYDRVVPDGSTLSIDFRTGEVLVDGISDGSTYLTRSEFFSIGPGVSADVQFNAIGGSSGTPMAAFTISDGYW